MATRRELRSFGLVVGTAFLALAAWQQWREHSRAAVVLAIVGAALVIAATALPAALGPVHRAWMAMAHAMSRVTTPVLLAVVYFVVLTPLALVMRMAGRSSIRRKRGAATYWVDRPPGARRGDMRRQF